jgi:hypothetical protein
VQGQSEHRLQHPAAVLRLAHNLCGALVNYTLLPSDAGERSPVMDKMMIR